MDPKSESMCYVYKAHISVLFLQDYTWTSGPNKKQVKVPAPEYTDYVLTVSCTVTSALNLVKGVVKEHFNQY